LTDAGGERVAYSRAGASPASLPRAALRFLAHRGLRALTLAQAAAMRLASLIGPRVRPLPPDGADVLVTGTFYAENWLAAHLRPIALSRGCRRLTVVTQFPVPAYENTVWVPPPAALRRVVGGTPARLLTFAWLALRQRPHVLGGFHLLLNGLVTQLLARLCGARSLYFCGGGPTEVLDGGVWSENRLFRRMETPDAVVERRLLAAVGRCDHVVTMGRRAIDFFRARGVDTDFRVISGGIDTAQFAPAGDAPVADVVFVARLSRVKRVDLLLRALALVARTRPETTAIIVGDGPLLEELRADARALGLSTAVTFAGHQKDVESWLRKGRPNRSPTTFMPSMSGPSITSSGRSAARRASSVSSTMNASMPSTSACVNRSCTGFSRQASASGVRFNDQRRQVKLGIDIGERASLDRENRRRRNERPFEPQPAVVRIYEFKRRFHRDRQHNRVQFAFHRA
jgi:glycosyltransferase involved in cell wall biosynthesis